MDLIGLLDRGVLVGSLAFGGLVALAAGLLWMAFRPATSGQLVQQRLNGYLERGVAVSDDTLDLPFGARVLGPMLRRILHFLGRLTPGRSIAATRQLLIYAGEPGRLSAIDFFGLRILLTGAFAGGYFLLLGAHQPLMLALRNCLILAFLGYFAPLYWLRRRSKARRHQIARALPDALDMMTIGVEAGLAFESALLRVGEQWHNPLTEELQRAVAEMRVGTPRDLALRRMADRSGVAELSSFVAVLIQSTQLGVTIAQVLYAQAAEMRLKRRQRAEELARQAGVKMVFPMIFFIFPAIFVVILGPSIPRIISAFANISGGISAGTLP